MINETIKLTIIIPFRNEGDEVKNTINSLLSTAGVKTNLILVNDQSTDGYDYKQVADFFKAEYIEHQHNLGVAASRDEAIGKCQTDYFIIFDAHMRAFTTNWAQIIIRELEKDHRCIICCTTIGLNKNAEPNKTTNQQAYGVTMHLPDLTYQWNTNWKGDIEHENSMIINCIMGASYACNKLYWEKLRGLEGLKSYGFDEQLISIKTFLEGGTCKVLNNIVFGHIFRDINEVPYHIKSSDFVFNALFIIELFFTEDMKIRKFRNLRYSCSDEVFQEAINLLSSYKEEIRKMETYYKQIFTNTIKHMMENDFSKYD